MKKLLFILTLTFGLAINLQAQKWEHVADTPTMGWSSWNKFGPDINEEKIKGIIDVMVTSGLRDAGYVYVNLDDCWHGERDANGFIQEDRQRFPHGIKWLADYAHSHGMKLGIYTCAGTQTCAGEPGSLGHEYQDALQYARWGIDFVKEDWCHTDGLVNPIGAYMTMSNALRATGRPMVLNICEWGRNHAWRWARDIGHSWRTTPDIGPIFDLAARKAQPRYRNLWPVTMILDYTDTLRQYAGPGHWNDPDMLEVGNGMSVNEDRAHFTMWCMLAAPLVLGNDLRHMTDATRDIIMNRDMIAIDQDSLGVQALHFCDDQGVAVWLKPLQHGDWALTLLNRSTQPVNFRLNWQELNLTDDQVSKRSTLMDTHVYRVYNLWSHRYEGKTSKKNKVDRTVKVPAHDVVAYRLIRQ